MNNHSELKEIVFQFVEQDNNVQIMPLGKGHINDSYKVISNGKEYVLQRINHHIFKNVDQLQDNIFRVTSHIRAKLEARGETDIERKVLSLLPARDEKLY
ncbi:MAG: aminoglycoside phosphotransferase, partial [Lentisphaerae bacterium]|nr:aminoglycoside phosphotransferase [Lentisphaerota bacterium]